MAPLFLFGLTVSGVHQPDAELLHYTVTSEIRLYKTSVFVLGSLFWITHFARGLIMNILWKGLRNGEELKPSYIATRVLGSRYSRPNQASNNYSLFLLIAY